MKKIWPVLVLALLGGAYYVYTEVLGGSLTGTAPSKGLPDVDPQLPEPGEAVDKGARGVEDGAKGAVDFLADLDPAVWRIVGILGVVAAIVWVIKNPKRLAIGLGVAVVALLVMLIG